MSHIQRNRANSVLQSVLMCTAAAAITACGASQAPEDSGDEEASTSASQLCVVRHAEAYKNLDPRPEGLTPEQLDTLTENGEMQSIALREQLPANVVLLWASPTHRTRQTAELLGNDLAVFLVVDDALRSLDGTMAWDDRVEAWSVGEDPRPSDGENLADGAERARALIARLRGWVDPGETAVVVTHGDIASIIVGELRGTPLLERPTVDEVATGEMVCIDW